MGQRIRVGFNFLHSFVFFDVRFCVLLLFLHKLDDGTGISELSLPFLSLLGREFLDNDLWQTLDESLGLHQVHSWLESTDFLQNLKLIGFREADKLDVLFGGSLGGTSRFGVLLLLRLGSKKMVSITV